MKILFLLGASSRIRNFDRTIRELADRGHTVHLTGRLRKGVFELPDSVSHERVSGGVNPTERIDEWRDIVDPLRGARDYVRYFDPRFTSATRLVRRAYEIAPTPVALFFERHAWLKRQWHLAARVLAFCESLVPVDPGFEAFLREERPDLVVVTPLVTFESYQTDYVKAAQHLGMPVAFIPFSWDNLTNKGLMRVVPDRVLVWNEIQGNEAVELHGCPPESVVVTGAARFDEFFARTPATSRADFCARFGLDPGRPLVVYLGSSQLTGPNELELVRRWAEALRAADDPAVRSCGIVIRPHPAVSDAWATVDVSDLGQAAVALGASRGADQELYDSLWHAHAAVGLNTSAMLEAAIVGRPVQTLIIPGFDEGQIGTIHFRYLVDAFGGLATIARDFDEHRRQLAEMLRGAPQESARSRAFAGSFLRPHGIDRPVSTILATEIERLGTIAKATQPAPPKWHRPLQWALVRALKQRSTTSGVKDATVVGTMMSLRPVRTALEEMRHSTDPIVVGPWVDTIAHELLYWIPFVRWATRTYGLDPSRLILVSMGADPAWYGELAAGRYVDAASLFSPADLDRWRQRSVLQSQQNAKQATISPFDRAVLNRTAETLGVSDYQVLHPMSFFRILHALRKTRALGDLAAVLDCRRFEGTRARIEGAPPSFVAVSTAFTDALPDSPENRAFAQTLIEHVAADHPVVLVDEPPVATGPLPSGRVQLLRTLAPDLPPHEAQTAALSQARAFFGGYGDLAVLAAFCGTSGTAYHSEKLLPDHADRLQATVSNDWAPVRIERARRFKGIRLPAVASARG